MITKSDNKHDRSEYVQDIIEKMPNKFAVYTTIIIVLIFVALIVLSCVINYSDTVSGSIVINTKYSTVKLVSNAAGRLTLLGFRSNDFVKQGDYLAVIQNPGNTDDIKSVLVLTSKYNLINSKIIDAYPLFPQNASLGEVDAKYFSFLNVLQQCYNYKKNNIYIKQKEDLESEITEYKYQLQNFNNLKNTQAKTVKLAKGLSDKDSILLAKKYATEEELDKSTISYLDSKSSLQRVLSEINNTESEIIDCENKIEQLNMQRIEKEKQMRIDLVTSYDDLKDNLKSWEQHYIIKSPIDGKLEYTQFWHNNQFVQMNEDVFTVAPSRNNIIGQVTLPAAGAGKVKINQDVIIKLNNYPYEEYGFIKGKVKSISLTTNVVKSSNQNLIDTYLVEVEIPNALKTNYGSELEFKYDLKGTADIISKHRRLIDRLFDNLKSTTRN